jgi:oligopeptide/dipeptide ABC transporter ATP-binding protein
MDQLLEIRNLVKEFHGRSLVARRRSAFRAVDRVSFGIEKNTIFGLVGESGCGKTTVSRAILQLDPPTSGEVWFAGTALAGLSGKALRGYRRRMQIVFQDPNSALKPKLRIGVSLEEGLVNLGVAKRERQQRVDEMLELVGISPSQRSRYPHEFSGGQKQRIVVARALTMQPEFLVLDEPVSNLDVSIQAQIVNLLLDVKARLSLTYLFISHDLNLVAYLSDRIAVMYKGRFVELGSTEQIMDRPVHPYTLRLFSASPTLHGTIQSSEKIQEDESTLGIDTGCPYAGQCERKESNCLKEEPELRDIGEGHLVACMKSMHNKVGTPA